MKARDHNQRRSLINFRFFTMYLLLNHHHYYFYMNKISIKTKNPLSLVLHFKIKTINLTSKIAYLTRSLDQRDVAVMFGFRSVLSPHPTQINTTLLEAYESHICSHKLLCFLCWLHWRAKTFSTGRPLILNRLSTLPEWNTSRGLKQLL